MEYGGIRQNFEKHGFSTQLFSTKEAARDYLVSALKNQTIGFGGSVTLQEMGLFEALQQTNAVVWHNKVPSRDVRYMASCANIYITSANAVTEGGQIVNIDGTGNRVAMTAFGPQTCYYVVGKNKITPNLEKAIYRCRNVAAPQNARRINAKTPCARNADKCYDCSSPARICRITAVIDRAPMGMKCEVIFVDEVLGY
ncbi:lactate utilization protein [Lacrimispora indolis]|uniref:lactate utilization protein n=1 Tax=Lacrimispora indolis TaxID=69825 RepID=UPI00045EA2DD|nr:lactate utilization protein [Lacrimispora indolis]